MDTKVIFDVLRNVRFNVMGSVKLPTPTTFDAMDEEDKNELYNKLFDAVFETCSALSALMTIEKNYQQLQSR